jgi:hypothetical protein
LDGLHQRDACKIGPSATILSSWGDQWSWWLWDLADVAGRGQG